MSIGRWVSAGLTAAAVVVGSVAAASSASAGEGREIPLVTPPPAVGGEEFPNFVHVRVGSDGEKGKVLLDTGSIGLHILKKYIGKDVEVTDKRVTYIYAGSGNKLIGRLGYARVYFPGSGGIATEKRIAINVVDEVTCDKQTPDCPGWKKGQVGVMGVGYYGTKVDKIFSPLVQLPGDLSDGLVVDTISKNPHLRLGPVPSDRYAFAAMRRARNSPPGTPMWDTWSVKVCFRIDGGAAACDRTLFDTGAGAVRFWPAGGANGGIVKLDGTLKSGHSVVMEAEGVFRLVVVSGEKRWNNVFHIEKPILTQLGPNAAGQIFRRFIVAFDFVNGRIGFCKPQKGSLSAKVATAKACR